MTLAVGGTLSNLSISCRKTTDSLLLLSSLYHSQAYWVPCGHRLWALDQLFHANIQKSASTCAKSHHFGSKNQKKFLARGGGLSPLPPPHTFAPHSNNPAYATAEILHCSSLSAFKCRNADLKHYFSVRHLHLHLVARLELSSSASEVIRHAGAI